ncbi:LOW QUALITY PROTEIN: dedicator of cytokinesis protein 3 [Nilaparvata lugens]|uniref:LOW QUALITY PROTEIN: dedicator of cytokinesis protein 3 n=1 Tax=Nilaparvata lugens TaxID=108931 RepID=UPI00193D08DD|nr:LOW QUALITY PROTEIN: dedicator of cytokinesis protein 3 [Nilaparvata lugens]
MWIPTKTKKYGVAIYNWNGEKRFGLPLEIGDTVHILEECTGWYRGFVTKNRSIKGIFPSNYIFLKPCKVENEGLYESVTSLEDPVVREVTLVLREWSVIWKSLFVERMKKNFDTLRNVMGELVEWRRQLLLGTLTQDQIRELKMKITGKIDWGNRSLGLDLVPRCGADMVDPSTMSIVDLYHVHVHSAESSLGASSRGTMRRKEGGKFLTHHLYLCMRDFGHHVGEDTEIFFSLYDAKKSVFISERFLVRISKEGFSNYVEKLNSNCTIFTDLGNGDLTSELYVVAHVLRLGRMLFSDSSKRSLTGGGGGGGASGGSSHSATFKRPHGVGVLCIGQMLYPTDEEREFPFRIYQGEDKDFYQLHEFIIKKQSNKFSPLSGQPNYGIVMSLKLLHGELSQVREENPLLFKNISLTRKLGFADVIMPGDIRNDLYITLEKGEFERGGKSSARNIEVTILALDSEGKTLPDLWGASGMEGACEYRSMIIYHNNSPCWYETIRLSAPTDKYLGGHIRLEFSHCSAREKTDNKKLFAFSFVHLMEPGGATLLDGVHELFVYRCDEKTRLHPSQYLGLPASGREAQNKPDLSSNSSQFTRSHKEIVTIRTMLCSTKLTQNVDLLSLLQWKSHPEKISEALTHALRLNGEELVKFLQDVLDALFSMFSTEDGNSTAHSGLVFHVLVSILNLLNNSKFEHFKPVMDAYIKDHFAAALVYKGLISSIQHCADWVSATEKQEPIQKCFRSLEYIFKFIIESRLLFARATGGQFEDSFRRDLYIVLTALSNMLTHTNEVILPTQIALLHSISAVYDQLTQVLSLLEVAKLASTMLESLPTRDLPPQLIQAKLKAISNLVTGELFKDDESRSLLLLTCCKHLRMHLSRRDELRLCTEILGEVISFIFKQQQASGKINNCLHHDLEIICLNTLDMLIQTVLILIDRSAAVLGSLVACLIGQLQLLDEGHYQRLWEELRDRKPLKDFLLRAFLVLRDLLKQDVFPVDWFVMKAAANAVVLAALKELAQPLVFCFLESRCQFDHQVWSNYFTLAVAFLTQPSLQLEKFSDVKREKVIAKYGDMRVLMGFQILSVWSKLGEHKVNFIPSMVGPFLEVTLVPEPELRKATLHIFFDMMDCEQRIHGNFDQVESELIDKLDILVSENKGDDEYRQLFNTMEHLSTVLLDRVQSEDPAWKENGSAFISSVTRLLERLLDYRSVIQGDENRDKRMSCTFNLLNFYKNEINRKEMYLRYIFKLHALHISADNFTEAGFTLKLYADSLSWSGTSPLLNDPEAPQGQPEWQRKEVLFHLIVKYFDRGKCWENGIPLLKELAELYEKRLYDYAKLGVALQTQARFYDNILHQLRPEPEYFRVGFYGLSFPMFLRNKVFIYRGLEYERVETFTQRMQMEFPLAQILTKNTPPTHTELHSNVQYIQICNVKPLPESGPPCVEGAPSIASVPHKIARFYQVNQVSRFQLDRPNHKPPIDKDNEFKSMWLERTLLVTSDSLPGILRWFEVVQMTVEEVPPVQFACETMQNVNSDLSQLIAAYTLDPKRSINMLSMRLSGTLDANVMGGIAKYQEAFFSADYIRNHPQYTSHVHRLHSLILEQVEILESGLVVHGQLAPPDVQPLHKRLLDRLDRLRHSLKRPADSIVHSPLPPLPVDHRQQVAQKPVPNEEYCNTVSGVYGHLAACETGDDIYSKPMEILETMDANDGASPPPAIPQRPKSSNYGVAEVEGEGGNVRRHQRTLSRGHQRMSSNDRELILEGGLSGEEAPPLPPRAPDKRNSGEVPPAPPKRLPGRKDSEPADSSLTTLMRDSGYSEQLNNLSGYEEWVLPPAVSPRSTAPPAPPPIPPKSGAPGQNPDEENGEPNIPPPHPENYSVPRIMNILD